MSFKASGSKIEKEFICVLIDDPIQELHLLQYPAAENLQVPIQSSKLSDSARNQDAFRMHVVFGRSEILLAVLVSKLPSLRLLRTREEIILKPWKDVSASSRMSSDFRNLIYPQTLKHLAITFALLECQRVQGKFFSLVVHTVYYRG